MLRVLVLVGLTFSSFAEARAQVVDDQLRAIYPDHFGPQCTDWVGQTVKPISFTQAVSKLPKVPPKGEYETTPQYEARRDAAIGSGGNQALIIARQPIDRGLFQYDADKQLLSVSAALFGSSELEAWQAFYGTAAFDLLKPSLDWNFNLVFSSVDRSEGSYAAQNSFGAKVVVRKVTRRVEAIFERPHLPLSGEHQGLFPSADFAPFAVGYLSLSPAEAKRLKPLLRLAIVAVPKEPYLVKGPAGYEEATIAHPVETRTDATVIIADMQCGLVLDDKGAVLGAYSIR